MTTTRASHLADVLTACCEVRSAAPPAGTPFAQRLPRWHVLTRREREHCAAGLPRLDRYAGRLAAKSAVQRLLSGRSAALADIEIRHGTGGRPVVALSGTARACAHELGVIDVSIAHRRGRGFAVATAGPSAGHEVGALEVGVDFVEVAPVAEGLHRWGDRFTDRVLTGRERSRDPFVSDRALGLAFGIAAKEASGKVLKRSWPAVSWLDVELELRDASSVPLSMLQLGGHLAREIQLDAITFGRCVPVSPPGSSARQLWVWLGGAGGTLYAVAAGRSGGARDGRPG